jgi:hypothetical protein
MFLAARAGIGFNMHLLKRTFFVVMLVGLLVGCEKELKPLPNPQEEDLLAGNKVGEPVLDESVYNVRETWPVENINEPEKISKKAEIENPPKASRNYCPFSYTIQTRDFITAFANEGEDEESIRGFPHDFVNPLPVKNPRARGNLPDVLEGFCTSNYTTLNNKREIVFFLYQTFSGAKIKEVAKSGQAKRVSPRYELHISDLYSVDNTKVPMKVSCPQEPLVSKLVQPTENPRDFFEVEYTKEICTFEIENYREITDKKTKYRVGMRGTLQNHPDSEVMEFKLADIYFDEVTPDVSRRP